MFWLKDRIDDDWVLVLAIVTLVVGFVVLLVT